MFNSARLQLTLWYLLIIMFISISFSVVIYRVLTIEVDRFATMQREKIERRLRGGKMLPPEFCSSASPPPVFFIDSDLVAETRHRLIISLAFINASIFVFSGILGYFLAGRTLRPIQEMLDEQNRFISDSSHELRTPLTSLKTALEVNLRDKNLTLKEARELLQESIEEVDKLKLLSDGLLELAQYQKPKSGQDFKKISVANLLDIALKKVHHLAKAKDIKLSIIKDESNILGDIESLSNLLVILIENAIKYSPEKKEITIVTKKHTKNIQISITDQGIGIGEKDIHHIFDRFYRADAARTKSQISGYGLGLSIAKKIAISHDGMITVHSQPGKGSTFTLILPR